MQKQVAERKADIRSQGSADSAQDTNAFSMLVEASENEEGKFKLDDSELVSISFTIISMFSMNSSLYLPIHF